MTGVATAHRLEKRVKVRPVSQRGEHFAFERVGVERRALARQRDAAQRLDDARYGPAAGVCVVRVCR